MSPATPAPETVLVSVCDLAPGGGRVSVRDARTRRAIPVEAASLRLTAEHVLCVELRVADRDGGLACVELPGGRFCWVRPYSPEPGRGTAA